MEAKLERTKEAGLGRRAFTKKIHALISVGILIATAVAYFGGYGTGSSASNMEARILADVTQATGIDAATMNKAEVARVYLESGVQDARHGYEMIWATSCSSANVRVAGVDEALMSKLRPVITKLGNKYGKADYMAIDRIYGQGAYSVCMMYDVELNQIQKHALSSLRGENRDFSCLTPIRRVCTMVSM